jgi:hypothetical protein
MFVCPCEALDATPVWLTTATVGDDDVHCETPVMSCVEPSLKRPMAAKGSLDPRAMVGEAGVTEMLWMVALETIRVVVAGTRPP